MQWLRVSINSTNCLENDLKCSMVQDKTGTKMRKASAQPMTMGSKVGGGGQTSTSTPAAVWHLVQKLFRVEDKSHMWIFNQLIAIYSRLQILRYHSKDEIGDKRVMVLPAWMYKSRFSCQKTCKQRWWPTNRATRRKDWYTSRCLPLWTRWGSSAPAWVAKIVSDWCEAGYSRLMASHPTWVWTFNKATHIQQKVTILAERQATVVQ